MPEIAIIFKIFIALTIRYFVIAGIPFLIFYKILTSKFIKRKIQEQKASKKDFWREIINSMLTNLVFLASALLLLLTPLKTYTKIYENIHDFPLWYLPISLVLALIVHDTYFYWMHRTLHTKFLYKHFHKTHHLSTNPSPWAAFSFHLGEAVFESLIIFIIVFLIPIHPSMIIAFTLASLTINVYGHLGFEIMPKWFRKRWSFQIFNTSVHHNMHHQYFEKNYGLYFRFWDRIMGTENKNYVKRFEEVVNN